MTVHDLHDALNLLPGDLITATDKLRTLPSPKVIRWKRWISLAACMVLVLSTTLVFRETILPGMGGKSEAAPEAPAAMALEMPENGIVTEVPAEEAAAQEAPAADMAGSSSAQTALGRDSKEELCIDHSHRFAEEAENDTPAVGYCGNMQTTVYLDGMNYTLAGSYSVIITDILIHLDYNPDEVCRCMTEFTVDTEEIPGIEVNLTEGFARCEQGQASLTEKQAELLREIISSLE